MKKYIAICIAILLCIIAICFSSCTTYENVTFIEHDNEQCLLYQGEEYYISSIFTATEYHGIANENDIELGWYYSFPFSTRFYSDTSESPVYIYTIGSDTNFYLKQDYDYKSEVFMIGNTTDTIIFSEAITDPCFEYDPSMQSNGTVELSMHSEQHPNLKISLLLFSNNNNWYIVLPTNEVYRVSSLFLKILKENGFIGK